MHLLLLERLGEHFLILLIYFIEVIKDADLRLVHFLNGLSYTLGHLTARFFERLTNLYQLF